MSNDARLGVCAATATARTHLAVGVVRHGSVRESVQARNLIAAARTAIAAVAPKARATAAAWVDHEPTNPTCSKSGSRAVLAVLLGDRTIVITTPATAISAATTVDRALYVDDIGKDLERGAILNVDSGACRHRESPHLREGPLQYIATIRREVRTRIVGTHDSCSLGAEAKKPNP